MGKLHTLRRAIRRNPQAFMRELPVFEQSGREEPRFTGIRLFSDGAQFRAGQWEPAVVNDHKVLFPYRRFVRSTLVSLGYDVAG